MLDCSQNEKVKKDKIKNTNDIEGFPFFNPSYKNRNTIDKGILR